MKISRVLLKLITCSLLVFVWIFTFYSYQNLPQIIAIHFDLQGNPNDFSTKQTIWVLPIIATFLFSLLFNLSKNPASALLNLPPNVKRNEKASVFILNSLNLVVMMMLSVATYETINIGLGNQKQLTSTTAYLLLLLFSGVLGIIFYSFYSKKLESKNIQR